MNVEQFFDKIKVMNKETDVTLKEFAKAMVDIRQDPEFWNEIMSIMEEKK